MTQTKRPRRPRDINQLAKALVEESVGETLPGKSEPDTRDPHAMGLGAKGWSKGGRARAATLSPERRREIAQRAAESRWKLSARGNKSGRDNE